MNFLLLGRWRQTLPIVSRHRNDGMCVLFALSVVVQALLGLTFRGLYADGARFAVDIASQQTFSIGTPARWMSAILFEIPSVAAAKLGVSPYHVALIFSFVTNLLPGALFLLCRAVLPATDRRYLVFPAFVYFAGVLSAQFASVTEGLLTTAYVWLLLYLILFGPLSTARLGLVLLLAVGSIRMHEEMSFLAPVLASAVWLRRSDATGRNSSIILYAVIYALVTSAVVAAYWIIGFPERHGSIINDLEGSLWLYIRGVGYNLPAALGLAGAFAIIGCVAMPQFSRLAAVTFWIAAVGLAISSFWVEALTLPSAQFAARHNAALMSFPVIIVLLIERRFPFAFARLTSQPVCSIVMALGVSASLWHIQATEKWSGFLSHFRSVLTSNNGIVPFSALLNPPDSREAKLTAMMSWSWTTPDLSILALPRSCLTSIIENRPGNASEMYRLQDPETLPQISGLSYVYPLSPEKQLAVCSHTSIRTGVNRD